MGPRRGGGGYSFKMRDGAIILRSELMVFNISFEGGMGMGMGGVLVLSTWQAPRRVSLYCSCLFGLVRHPGTATAVAEAQVKRLCSAVYCVLSQWLLPWGRLH